MVMTWMTIDASMRLGRLRGYATVDNVISFARGAEWVRVVERGGVVGLVKEYVERPPHAPYSTVSAFVGFEVLGVRDVSAHVMAGVILATGFGAVWVLAGGSRVRGWRELMTACVLLMAAACVPIWAWSVEVLKPDLFAGVVSAIGMAACVGQPQKKRGLHAWFGIGAIFGVALWAKPSVFPQTLFFLGAAGVIRVGAEIAMGAPVALRRRCVEMMCLLGGAVVIALPHYALALPQEVKYIIDNVFGERRSIWAFRGSVWEHGVFYLVHPRGGGMLLGWPGWALGIGAVISGYVAVRRGGAGRVYALAWAGLLGAAYLPPMVNPMKIPQFAAGFQFLVVFAGVMGLAYLGRIARGAGGWRERVGAGLVVGAAVGVCVGTFAWPFDRTPEEPERRVARVEQTRERVRVVESVYALVREAAERRGRGETTRVVIAGSLGEVNHHLLTYWGVRDGVELKCCMIRRLVDDAEFERRLAGADVVVANEGGTGMVYVRKAHEGMNEALIARMRRRDEWRKVGRVVVEENRRAFEVFERVGDAGAARGEEPTGEDEAADRTEP